MTTVPSGTHRIPVAILGATGAVGQTFVRLLDGHPWFELTEVAAAGRAGRPGIGTSNANASTRKSPRRSDRPAGRTRTRRTGSKAGFRSASRT